MAVVALKQGRQNLVGLPCQDALPWVAYRSGIGASDAWDDARRVPLRDAGQALQSETRVADGVER